MGSRRRKAAIERKKSWGDHYAEIVRDLPRRILFPADSEQRGGDKPPSLSTTPASARVAAADTCDLCGIRLPQGDIDAGLEVCFWCDPPWEG